MGNIIQIISSDIIEHRETLVSCLSHASCYMSFGILPNAYRHYLEGGLGVPMFHCIYKTPLFAVNAALNLKKKSPEER